jgi:hypothetical protein
MYALQKGSSEMRSYAQIKKTGRYRQAVGPSMLFRFTERDVHQDDIKGHKVTRYVQRNGDWTLG